jgi:2-keto-4-pentenoate hydratase/2-oxohepta-3-ene-1,7-dioic acid hydratase in catechol pathway
MIESPSGSRPVVVTEEGYIDIRRHLPDAPSSMIAIIKDWNMLSDPISKLAASAADGPISKSQLAAPLERPGKIMAIGLNYADHCEESNMPLPDKQIWFSKAQTAINPPYAPIELPAMSNSLDYEAELVVVIGKTCRNVPKERFKEVVFGYCVGNDVSVRELQMATSQWVLGKSFDKSAPIGPWITTVDEVDPHSLGIRSYVNDELRQNSNTKYLVFKVGDMIEHLSKAMTLEPGDLIFTGTAGGVGMVWKGSPHYLKPGDRSRVEIDQLGMIEAIVEPGPTSTRID